MSFKYDFINYHHFLDKAVGKNSYEMKVMRAFPPNVHYLCSLGRCVIIDYLWDHPANRKDLAGSSNAFDFMYAPSSYAEDPEKILKNHLVNIDVIDSRLPLGYLEGLDDVYMGKNMPFYATKLKTTGNYPIQLGGMIKFINEKDN